MKPLRVIVVGLGPIGQALAARVLREPAFELVGAADSAPGLAGRGLADVLGAGPAAAIRSRALQAADEQRPDVALHAAGSRLEQAGRTSPRCCRAGSTSCRRARSWPGPSAATARWRGSSTRWRARPARCCWARGSTPAS